MLKDFQGAVRQLAENNASTILTAGGVVGTVATAVLTARATFKAAMLIHEEEIKHIQQADEKTMGLGKMDKVKLVGAEYIPPVIVGSLTIGSIIMANHISATKAATLAAAYGMSQNRLDEYKAKVAEKLTGPKKQSVDDEIAQDRVNKNPPGNEVIILAGGDVLCYDMLSGRYFRSTMEQIRRAEHVLNTRIANCQYASLTEFYDEIGLPPTNLSDSLGWSSFTQDMPLELKISTTLTPDEKPCIAIDFGVLPVPDYARNY